MKFSRALAASVAVVALLTAQNVRAGPPDYVGFGERFKLVARISTSIKSCERFGYRTGVSSSDEMLDRLVNPAINDAIRGGIDLTTAKAMMAGALQEESANQKYLSDHAADGANTTAELEAAAVTMLDYWAARCAELADDPLGRRFIVHTTPEAEAAARQAQIDALRKAIRDAAAE